MFSIVGLSCDDAALDEITCLSEYCSIMILDLQYYIMFIFLEALRISLVGLS